MSKYTVSFFKLIGETLPPKKRQERRITFLFKASAWIRGIHEEFLGLQVALEYKAKITSHVVIFESYLIDTFGAGITITVNEITQNKPVVYSSSDSRVGMNVIAHNQADGGSSMKSHSESINLVNFIVNVPAGLSADLDQMSALIDKYKAPGSTYQIIES
jgi:hypothetical protein